MEDRYSRTKLLIGQNALNRLKGCRVAVFGVGGVGGYVVEALARSGIGALDLIDSDAVALSNLNRQIIALESTVGQLKVDIFEKRIHEIDPSVKVRKYPMFYMPEKRGEIPFPEFDYIVDAIDTVAAKLDIIQAASDLGIPVISAMGCGNRLDPGKLLVTDINKTSGDPLAKVIRKELRLRGIKKLKVVYSSELPTKPGSADSELPTKPGTTDSELPTKPGSAEDEPEPPKRKRSTPGSMTFVPASAGLMIASEVVRALISTEVQP